MIDPYFPLWRPEKEFIHPESPLDESKFPVDAVLVTHDHRDHNCPESLHRLSLANPRVQFFGPADVVRRMRQARLPEVQTAEVAAGDSFEISSAHVHVVWSKPPEGDSDAGIAPPDVTHLGYVVEVDAKRIYFSGDPRKQFTEFSTMERILKINGTPPYSQPTGSTGWGKDGADSNIEAGQPPLRLAALIPVRVLPGDNLDLIFELVQATIRSARDCPLTERVYLSSNDASLVAAAESLGAHAAFLRDDGLSSSEVRADTALQDMLVRPETELKYIPDLVNPMEITYPFRPEGLLSRLVQKLVSERLNTVIAGYSEHRPVWMRRDATLVRLDAYEQNRDQREPLHVGLASLGCVTYAELLRKGSRFGSHVGVFEIQDPLAVVEIRDFVDPAPYHRLRRAFEPGELA